MKVAYVTKQLPFGFSEAFILPEIAEHGATPGWEVWLAPLGGGKLVHDAGLLASTIAAPLLAPTMVLAVLVELLGHPWRTAALALRLMRTRTPGLALRNLAVFPKGCWLGRRLKRDRFDHVHIHFAAAPATMGVVAAHVAGLPYSVTAHRYDIAQNNLLGWKAHGARFLRAIDAAGAVEISNHVAAGGGHRPMNLLVLHMGVAVPDRPAPRRAGPLAPLRLAMAARMVGKKGHGHVLAALAIARDQGQPITLTLFGDGPLEPVLRAHAGQLGLGDSVVWRGATAHHTMLEALQAGAFDAAVLPSVTSAGDKEGIPVFLIEAMAAGLPVITTANGGIAELAGGGAGVIVPEADPPALAAGMIRLARDDTERARLAQAGRARVCAQFEIAANMRRLRALMQGPGAGSPPG